MIYLIVLACLLVFCALLLTGGSSENTVMARFKRDEENK